MANLSQPALSRTIKLLEEDLGDSSGRPDQSFTLSRHPVLVWERPETLHRADGLRFFR